MVRKAAAKPTPDEQPKKRGRGRPPKDDSGEGRRFRVSVTIPESEVPLFKQWADQEKLELATLLSRLVRLALEQAIKSGVLVSATSDKVEETELLKGFLRCLAEEWDTDGYSVAEVGRLLGFSGNVELDRLIEALEQVKAMGEQNGSRSKGKSINT